MSTCIYKGPFYKIQGYIINKDLKKNYIIKYNNIKYLFARVLFNLLNLVFYLKLMSVNFSLYLKLMCVKFSFYLYLKLMCHTIISLTIIIIKIQTTSMKY